MAFRTLTALILSTVIASLSGCSKGPPTTGDPPPKPDETPAGPFEVKTGPVTFPELGLGRPIKPGVLFDEVTLQRGGVPMRVWVYRPQKAAGKLPLVLVPPAGSRLFDGMDLGDGDREEHYPYVKAGFAVVSFQIDGQVPEDGGEPALYQGARQFKDAQAGLANAKAALDFALAKVPNLDADRVYIAGHSSAATLALLFAEHEPRIKACVAYAPCTDVESRLAPALGDLNRAIPGFRSFIRSSSPKSHVDRLKCPTFLFHAQDDQNVPVRETQDFAAALKKTNPAVTLVLTPRGGHHDSMVREGMPKAIQWLQKGP